MYKVVQCQRCRAAALQLFPALLPGSSNMAPLCGYGRRLPRATRYFNHLITHLPRHPQPHLPAAGHGAGGQVGAE